MTAKQIILKAHYFSFAENCILILHVFVTWRKKGGKKKKLYIAQPKADKRHGFLSLAGAATSIIFVPTKLL